MKIKRSGPRFKLENDWQKKPVRLYFSSRKLDLPTILIVLVGAAVVFFLLLFNSEPVFHPIRSSLAFRIIIRLVFLGCVVGAVTLSRHISSPPPLFLRLALLFTGLLPFGELIFPTDRIVVFFHTVLFIFYVVYTLLTFWGREVHIISLAAAVYLGIRLYMASLTRFTVIGDSIIIFAFVAGIILALAAAVVYFMNGGTARRLYILEVICLIFFVFVFSYALTEAAAVNANYALDFSEPQHNEVVIADKTIDYNRRGPNFYYFEISTADGKLKLNVSAAQFNMHEEGEKITVIRHEGTFGVPYYMLTEK